MSSKIFFFLRELLLLLLFQFFFPTAFFGSLRYLNCFYSRSLERAGRQSVSAACHDSPKVD